MGEDVVPELVQTLDARCAIDRLRPDVVHDHAFVSPVAAPAGAPYIVTAHSAGHRPFDDYYRRLSERVALVPISDAQRRHLPDARWAATVANAIDVESFPFGPAGGEDFVFLGRIAEEKGAHLAAEAAHRCGAPLILAGRVGVAEEQEYFDERVRPLLDDRVLFLGEVDSGQKRGLLAGARALLFPIEWDEPFGLVVVEALACGTPVIAFRRGAVPELIEDGTTGFIVDDLDGMVAAMGKVADIDRAACRRSVEGGSASTGWWTSTRRSTGAWLAKSSPSPYPERAADSRGDAQSRLPGTCRGERAHAPHVTPPLPSAEAFFIVWRRDAQR
jgi:glycosyltransferase involved in cell wall biosynthesis